MGVSLANINYGGYSFVIHRYVAGEYGFNMDSIELGSTFGDKISAFDDIVTPFITEVE